jgi:peptidoglycan hydrolase-like protein with peptidoglycan-binding domain
MVVRIQWPRDTEADLIAYYGEPKTAALESQLVDVVPPFKMYYEGEPVKRIRFHKKAAPALKAALDDIWAAYGHDQAAIDRDRVSVFDGSYNPRKIAGSNRWSNHAFGAAIDIDAAHNGFNTGHGTMPQKVVNAFKHYGARWGGDYSGRTDPMHLEFCGGGVCILPEAGEVQIPGLPIPELLPPTLQRGSTGEDVRRLQQIFFVDGVFGGVTEQAVMQFQKQHGLDDDGIVGPDTWRELLKIALVIIPPSPKPATKWQIGITATVFGGKDDLNESAYTGKVLNDTDLYVALPYRFKGTRPRVLVSSHSTTVEAPIEDVGPWNIDDPYWETNARPQAESGKDKQGRTTNLAGIDLSPALAKLLSIKGIGEVDWEFVDDLEAVKPSPVKQPDALKPAPASWMDFDIWGWLKSKFTRRFP